MFFNYVKKNGKEKKERMNNIRMNSYKCTHIYLFAHISIKQTPALAHAHNMLHAHTHTHYTHVHTNTKTLTH